MEATATAGTGLWERIPGWAKIAVPLVVVLAYLGWLLAGSLAPVASRGPADPARPLSCFGGGGKPFECVQGAGGQVGQVEAGQPCPGGRVWMESGYAPFYGDEVLFECVRLPLHNRRP